MRRVLVLILLIPLVPALEDPDPSDLQWACGSGRNGVAPGHPEACGINPIGGDFPDNMKGGDPVWSTNDWISSTDRVMGVEIDGDVRAVPIKMLNSHEIVNDEIGGVPVAITFCPLCGSGITFDRRITVDGEEILTSFTASGYLWKSDMVMWDSELGALWNQLTGETIAHLEDGRPVAEKHDISLDFVSSSVSTWDGWKDKHPNTLLLQSAGASYRENAYGDLATNCQQGFSNRNDCDVNGLHPKTQVVAAPEPPVAFPWVQVADIGGAYLLVGDTHYAATADLSGDAAIFQIDRALAKGESGLWSDGQGGLWAPEEFHLLGERVDQGITFWFAWQDHHPDTAVWMAESAQGNELQYDNGELPGFMPVVVLAVLFLGAFLWKNRNGQA